MANTSLAPTGVVSNHVQRRSLFAGAGLFALVGTAAAGSSVPPPASGALSLPPAGHSDAELLSLRAELDAAAAATGYDDTGPHLTDAQLTRASERLIDACWEIANAPPAQTSAGLAIKAAGAMHQLRFSYAGGGWGGDGEEMAWDLLSELAGDVYVAPLMPECLRESEEPGRA